MATVELTTVLEHSGEDRIDDVDQLILRGAKLVGFNPDVARRLSQLQVLSLSHNLLASLQHFQFMESLLELNLNFNQLSSLKGLACPRLEKLYLSHNRVASVEALYGFNSLSVLCLYHNSLIDLSEVLAVLRTLPKLRELDLAGNHCTKDGSAQHEIVTQLPRLRQLDGEPVVALDRELAEMYFAKHRRRTAQRASARPSTAPSGGGGGGLKATSSFNGAVPLSKDAQLFRSSDLNENAKVIEYLAMAAVNDPFDQAPSAASPASGRGGGDGDSDDGAMAAAPPPALSAAPRSRGSSRGKRLGKAGTLPRPRSLRRLGSDASLTLASERPPLPSPLPSPVASGGGSSVVGRLRAVRRGRPTSTGSTGSEGLGDSGPEGADGGAVSSARPPRPRTRSGGSSQAVDVPETGGGGGFAGTVGTGAGGAGAAAGAPQQAGVSRRVAASPRRTLDPSDPHVTIRKLLKTVEVLQSEREQLQKTVSNLTAGLSDANAGDDTDVAALAASGISWGDLVRENQELRSENANMYILKEENAALRHRNKQLLRQLDENSLVLENKRLQSELREAQHTISRERRAPLQSASGAPLQRPQTPAEVLADCEDVDAELASLIKRNQSSLAGIKRDLQAAKREAWTASRDGSGGAGTAAGSRRPPPTPPGQRRMKSGASAAGRVSPRTTFGRRYRPSPEADADAGVGSGSARAAGVAMPAPDPSRALVRPGTPNLLGREIKSAADVQAAYEAVAQAQSRRADLDASRQALLSARGNRVEYGGTAAQKPQASAGSQGGDGGGASAKVYSTSEHHVDGADIMVLHEEDAGGQRESKASGAAGGDDEGDTDEYETSSGGEDDDSQGYGSSFAEDADA